MRGQDRGQVVVLDLWGLAGVRNGDTRYRNSKLAAWLVCAVRLYENNGSEESLFKEMFLV